MKYIGSLIITILIMISVAGNIYAYEYQGIDIRGFISQGYLYSTDNNFFADTEDGTPQFNEAAINFSADVSDRLRLGLQFLARDMGSIGNNEVLLDWAIADYRWRDWMGVMVGNMKFVHGLYNETRDVDMLRTFVFLPQSVYNETWRESIASVQGASIYGDISLGDAGSLTYDVQYGTVNIAPDKGAARLLEDQWPFRTKLGLSIDIDRIDVDYTYTGSLKWVTNVEGLVLGTSTWRYKFDADCTTMYDTTHPSYAMFLFEDNLGVLNTQLTVSPSVFTADAETYTGSVEFTWRNLVFAAEYMRTTYQLEIKNDLFSSTGAFHGSLVSNGADVSDDGTVEIDRFSAVGYYLSLAYRFTPWFELGAYYSEYYPNEDDKDGKERVQKGLDAEDYRGWLKDICVTTRFDVSENWIFKLEGHKMNGAAIMLGVDNPAPEDSSQDRYEEDWYLFAAKATYNF
jgi:hypothetical protein